MEQCLADRGDGEELVDTKLGGVHRRIADYSPPNYASSVCYEHWPADYAVDF